jgi:hypothetical protein
MNFDDFGVNLDRFKLIELENEDHFNTEEMNDLLETIKMFENNLLESKNEQISFFDDVVDLIRSASQRSRSFPPVEIELILA